MNRFPDGRFRSSSAASTSVSREKHEPSRPYHGRFNPWVPLMLAIGATLCILSVLIVLFRPPSSVHFWHRDIGAEAGKEHLFLTFDLTVQTEARPIVDVSQFECSNLVIPASLWLPIAPGTNGQVVVRIPDATFDALPRDADCFYHLAWHYPTRLWIYSERYDLDSEAFKIVGR